jgi:two-component system copper resistance phosphate regulon response regulator CusR
VVIAKHVKVHAGRAVGDRKASPFLLWYLSPTLKGPARRDRRKESLMKLLVIEDDRRTALQLDRGLTESGFTADVAGTASDGLHLARTRQYDAILLDLGLPGRDGWSVLESLREAGDRTPVLCLTARDAVDDRVRGLDLGADDYLVKPYAFAELLARLRAVLRRGDRASDVVTVADLRIDIAARRAHRGGVPLDLRPKEFALLALFARRSGHVLSRATIVDRVWDASFEYDSNVVDVQVKRLRDKVDGQFPVKLIHTIRGAGYVLEDRG